MKKDEIIKLLEEREREVSNAWIEATKETKEAKLEGERNGLRYALRLIRGW